MLILTSTQHVAAVTGGTMNIFVLSECPVEAAQMQCDKHVVKMVLESAQMLCIPWDNAPYKKAHVGHPCSVWARRTTANYQWLLDHAYALADEYTFRYGKSHKSLQVIQWCHGQFDKFPHIIPSGNLLPFAQCMPDDCKHDDPVQAYKWYYASHKRHIAQWNKGRVRPAFMDENLIQL
jgi:hypothetical protein